MISSINIYQYSTDIFRKTAITATIKPNHIPLITVPKRKTGVKQISLSLRPDDIDNLKTTAAKLDYTYAERGSLSKLLRAIAKGKIELRPKIDK